MSYVLAVLLCMGIPSFHNLMAVYKHMHDEAAPRPSAYVGVAVLGALLVGIGFGIGLFPSSSWRPGHDTNYAPLLLLIGGLAVFLAGAFNAFRGSKAPYGSWIVVALAGLHLVYSSVDHMGFYRNKDKVGIMATQLAEGAGIKCAAPFLIIKDEGNAFRYRCPTVLQLGNEIGEPFIPWPAYREGVSEKLPKVLADLRAQIAKEEVEYEKRKAEHEKSN